MCSGNNANPHYALQQQLKGRAKKEKKQQKRRDERQAEYDAIAERRTAKEEEMAAEMKTMRQEARVDRREARQDARAAQGAQQYSSPAPAVAPAPSVAVESTQAVPGGNSGNQAPTAALSGRKGRRARGRGPSSSLRIDPASSVAGVGPNIAV